MNAAEQCFGREADGRLCRNKALGNGPYLNRCKKHSIAALRLYEHEHPQLAWYLKFRHLLEDRP